MATILVGLLSSHSPLRALPFVTSVSMAILKFKYPLALQKLSNKDNVDKILSSPIL